MKQGKTRHIGVTKLYMLHIVRERSDWRDFFAGVAPDATREDVMRALRDDQRNVFCGCNCAKAVDGSCLGIETED